MCQMVLISISISDSILDEVSNNNMHPNIIKRETMTAAYDCNTYQLTPDSPISSSQSQLPTVTIGANPIPIPISGGYSSEYLVNKFLLSRLLFEINELSAI